MKNPIITPRFIALSSLILIAAFARLIPHLPNFTPVLAIALLGGSNFNSKTWAFIVPFATMLLSDLIIGFHNTMFAVYLGFAVAVLLGMMIRNKQKLATITAATLISSVLFFIITNLGVWLSGSLYPQTTEGLVTCFINALPFFKYSLLGDVFYSALLFGSFHLVQLKFPALARS